MLKRGGVPGGRVVLAATGLVVAAAVAEAAWLGAIGPATGATLLVVSVAASVVTRAGDRSLPAMMPPLAFLAAALVGGQLLVDQTIEDPLVRQATMLVEVLGAGWIWVISATACSVSISVSRHLLDRRRERRTPASAAAPAEATLR